MTQFNSTSMTLAGTGLLVCFGQTALAQEAPLAPVASPEVYKVLAENDQWRVIEATWAPGQQDAMHSHPADRVSLYVTDCHLLITTADGSSREGKPKAGAVRVISGAPVAAHIAKNIGDSPCVIRIVELK